MGSQLAQPARSGQVLSCTFRSGADDCHAWLYRPERDDHRHPVVVMAHGLGGTKRMGLGKFAQRFRAAGYACLVFDYRYYGKSGGEPRGLLDIPSQLADWHAALEYGRSLDCVDPKRLVLWGTSFSAGHALVLAAQDPRIAAAILQCPFMDGAASVAALDWKTNARITVLAVCDRLAAWIGAAPVRVSVVGRPESTALMRSPGAVAGYNALKEASGATDAPGTVPARIALQLPRYRPGKQARKVQRPVLFCICDRDSVAPARATIRQAAQAPQAEIVHFDGEHFDLYLGDPFEKNIRAQLAFLKRHLPAGPGVGA